MATRIEAFEVIVPAATAEATPADTDLDMIPGRVESLQVMIPPGPSGLVGFAFVLSGQQVIPFKDGLFIKADNETITWDLERFPEVGTWTVRAFNTDVYDHTLFIRMSMDDEVPEQTPGSVTGTEELFIPPGGEPEEEGEGELGPLDFVGDVDEEPE